MLLLLLAGLVSTALAFDCPTNCSCATGDELEYYCPVADDHVTFKGRFHEYAIVHCQGTNFTCDDLPIINFGSSMPLPSLGVKTCPPSILPCLNQALNTPSIGYVTLIDTTEPLELQDVQELGDVKNLVIMNGADRKIPITVINYLKTLENFRMTNTPLTLHSNDFTNSTPLVFLELSMAGIKVLPDDAFNGLGSLKTLNVWGNRFSEVKVDSLRGLSSLQILSLDSNHIAHMAVGSLNHAPLLKSISLVRNQLVELPPGLFHNLTKLENITIQSNAVTLSLHNHSFSNLPSLRNLILEDCGIKLLEQPISGSFNIEHLSLYSNEIESIPLSFFKDMPSLQRLDLSYNRIKKLDSGVFQALKNLEFLNLNRNHLEVLPDFLFSGLKKLNHVTIENNYLTHISEFTFQGAINLQTISLKSNQLTLHPFPQSANEDYYTNLNVMSPFENLLELKNLYLNDNSINTMFEDWNLILTKLENLDLSYNNFTMLQQLDFQFLSNKVTVDLRHNNITSIILDNATSPDDYKSPLDLKSPDTSKSPTSSILLDNNPLMCDCGMYNLALRLKGYKYINAEPKFVLGNAKCESPQRLNGDLFINVSPADLNCDLPVEACMQNCSVCEMRPGKEDLFFKCTSKPQFFPNPLDFNAKSISLRLYEQPSYINDLNLQLLNLSNIGLKEITFEPSNSVKMIDFSKNNLSKIPVEFLKLNTTLYLSNNPFKCECGNTEEILLLKQSLYIKDLDKITCENGDKILLKDINSLCSSKRAAVIAIATFLVLFLTMAIFLAIIYRFSRTILVFLIEKGLFPSCFVDDQVDKNKEFDVFISYAHKDREFLTKLLPKLENDFGLKTCVHYRDWAVGDFIPDQINRSVENSRRTIILLSDNFLESDYANMEFRAAHNLALKEGKTRVILILLHDITKHEKLSDELKLHMKMNTYLKWDDFRFSERLEKALPLKNNKKFVLTNVFKQVQEKSVKPGLDVHLNSNGQLVNMAVKDVV
ncbi:protein toll [Helicoverpa armigera]|uniref:protein toll n=1 Tax=Helicoverpa armigera TaxID=29058 RepID=UPI003082DD5A